MLQDNYLCLVESNKQQIEEVKSKTQAENSDTRRLLSESGFVLFIAPLSFSRDRRIKMNKSSHILTLVELTVMCYSYKDQCAK